MSGADSLRVTVVGSANIDYVASCERLPRPGETVTDAEFERVPGGKGANQALAAARLGAAVRFVGRVGRDESPLRSLRAEGVDVSCVGRDGGETGVAFVVVAGTGENMIVVAPGANRRLTRDEVLRAFGARLDALICQQEIPVEAITAAAHAARDAESMFCLNAAPARGPVDPALAPDLLVVNRYEQEVADISAGLVAVTLGADGAVLFEAGVEVARAGPPPIEAVDGTAAGDAFCAALVISLLEKRDRQEALKRACAAGALAASRKGAQPSLPTAAELEAAL